MVRRLQKKMIATRHASSSTSSSWTSYHVQRVELIFFCLEKDFFSHVNVATQIKTKTKRNLGCVFICFRCKIQNTGFMLLLRFCRLYTESAKLLFFSFFSIYLLFLFYYIYHAHRNKLHTFLLLLNMFIYVGVFVDLVKVFAHVWKL